MVLRATVTEPGEPWGCRQKTRHRNSEMWLLRRTDGIHRNGCARHLTFYNYVLPSELVELCFVSFQGVDLAATDKSEVRALLDAFPRAISGCRVFYHVVCGTHCVAQCS